MMEQEFLRRCQQQAYFAHHKKVLVAVSGGLDSMTLLDLLYRFRKKLAIELSIAHINHKQRPESDEEEAALLQIAQELGLKIFRSNFSGKFTEKAARDFRYRFFAQIMAEENCSALVTAHHADDQAETIFMRMLRGNRLFHLSGMKERQSFASGELIRPLLHFHKADFPELLHFEDQSNRESHYLRNRIRNDYLPLLSKENPRFNEALLELGGEIELLQTALATFTKDMELTDLATFRQQDEGLQVFLLQSYLEKFPDLQVTKAQFAEILHILREPSNYQHHLKGQYELVKDYESFEIRKISPQPDFKGESILLKFDNIVEFRDYRFSFGRALTGENLHIIPLASTKDILLRPRQAGDEILLHGQHKKLRRFFINEKIPLKERQEAIILEQDEKILAITGIAVSDLSKRLKSDIIKSNLYIQKLDR